MADYGDDLEIPEIEGEFELGSDDREDMSDRELDDTLDGIGRELAFEDEPERESPEIIAYADRFYELGQRGFESEAQLEENVQSILNEMERDFFFKSLVKKIKKGGKSLLKKGIKMVGKKIPGIKMVTSLARGNLKGLLSSLAKTGLSAMVPGGAAILPVLQSLGLGFNPGEPAAQQEAWRNYSGIVREAYNYLAEDLNELSDTPAEASKIAAGAFNKALKRKTLHRIPSSKGERAYRVRVNAGETVTISIRGA
jgi:hypothetical protein